MSGATRNTGPYGTAPADNPDYQWVQMDFTLNRDDVLQYFVNIYTGNRVYGRTSGTFSDHIHLYTLAGVDTGYNLDPVSGEISKNGNILGDILQVGGAFAQFLIPGFGQAIDAGANVAAGQLNTTNNPQGVQILPPATPAPGSSTASGGKLPTIDLVFIAALVGIGVWGLSS